MQSPRIRSSVPLSAVIGTNRLFVRTGLSKKPTYTVNWCSPCCHHKHQNAKQIVSTLTFELDSRLKQKVDEVGLLLRHLNRYNLVCFLELPTPLTLPAPLKCGLLLALKTHAI